MLPFLLNTSFFGQETFHLPKSHCYAARIPLIDSRSEEGTEEEEMRQRLKSFMNPIKTEDINIFSLSVPSDCRPILWEYRVPFMLYFSGTFPPRSSADTVHFTADKIGRTTNCADFYIRGINNTVLTVQAKDEKEPIDGHQLGPKKKKKKNKNK